MNIKGFGAARLLSPDNVACPAIRGSRATSSHTAGRAGLLPMWEYPLDRRGVQYQLTSSNGGRWPRSRWRSETMEIVRLWHTHAIEFTAIPSDWAIHCHMSHDTMNVMGRDVPKLPGVAQVRIESEIREFLPGHMAMGRYGMAEHQDHTDSGHVRGPRTTLPMMGGMFAVVTVRDNLRREDYSNPSLYRAARGAIAPTVSCDPAFGNPAHCGAASP